MLRPSSTPLSSSLLSSRPSSCSISSSGASCPNRRTLLGVSRALARLGGTRQTTKTIDKVPIKSLRLTVFYRCNLQIFIEINHICKARFHHLLNLGLRFFVRGGRCSHGRVCVCSSCFGLREVVSSVATRQESGDQLWHHPRGQTTTVETQKFGVDLQPNQKHFCGIRVNTDLFSLQTPAPHLVGSKCLRRGASRGPPRGSTLHQPVFNRN